MTKMDDDGQHLTVQTNEDENQIATTNESKLLERPETQIKPAEDIKTEVSVPISSDSFNKSKETIL